MSGVLHSLIGSSSGGDRYTVTVGNSGDVYGYNDGTPIGSLSSSTFRGVTIKVVSNNVTDDTFTVTLSGVQVQSFFGGIEIQRTDGAIQIYNTPDTSTFVSGPTNTSWQWTMSSDNWTATGTRLVRLF